MKLQRLGGYAAIASLIVIVLFLAIALNLGKRFGGDLWGDPAKYMAAVSTAPVNFYAVNILHIVHFIFCTS